MDGCFEAQIVNSFVLNRKGLEEIRKRPKPKYAPLRRVKEEITDFKEYFKLKKELQQGNFDRKALGTYEDLDALLAHKRKKKEARELERR